MHAYKKGILITSHKLIPLHIDTFPIIFPKFNKPNTAKTNTTITIHLRTVAMAIHHRMTIIIIIGISISISIGTNQYTISFLLNLISSNNPKYITSVIKSKPIYILVFLYVFYFVPFILL